MAVEVTAQASDFAAGPTGNFPSINLNPSGGGRFLLIHMSWFIIPGIDANPPTVNGSSAGIFLIGSIQLINLDRDRHALYGLINPPGTPITITATIDDNQTNGLVIGAVAYSGVSHVTPIGAYEQTTGEGTALSATPAGGMSNGLVVSSERSRTPSTSVSHGQTLDWEIESPGGSSLTAAMTHATGASITMTHTIDATAKWMQTAVALMAHGARAPFVTRLGGLRQ